MRGRLVMLAVAAAASCAAAPTTATSTTATPTAPTTTSASAPAADPATATPPTVGRSVWVKVSVATLWTSTTAPRRIDRPALRAPADIRGWLAGMDTAARRGLVGRVETQALYGERLLVTAVRPYWLHVVAVGQRTHRDRRGYPGWVPTRQVTTTRPMTTATVATVVRRTAWLHDLAGRRVVEVSIGTRLPVLSRTATRVAVATPVRSRLYVATTAVVVRTPASPARARTAAGVATTARGFIGLPYLWGGRSGFAVDCSGLTQLVYALHGIAIPRDTDDQARAGTAARLSALHVADLVFFRDGATIGHVGLYVGSGRMVHAPHTGTTVRVAGVGAPALARRFL